MTVCRVEGCNKGLVTRGYCNAHYIRLRRYGSPHGSKPRAKKTLEARFWVKVDVRGPDECWEWCAYIEPNGYGRIRNYDGSQLAHRIAYELTNGPIPDGRELDHLCRNTICVNPDHLEIVTPRENRLREWEARQVG